LFDEAVPHEYGGDGATGLHGAKAALIAKEAKLAAKLFVG
jgi:hypothetical protein